MKVPGVTSYVAGGLGNQLFMVAAGWEQAARIGCPLYLNTTHLEVSGTRTLEISEIDFPVSSYDVTPAWASFRVPGNRVLPRPRINALCERVFIETNPSIYNPRIQEIREGTTLIGYFQSPLYFANLGDKIAELLSNSKMSASDSRFVESITGKDAITLHLRRGDYLDGKAVVASLGYAERAIRLLRRLGNRDPIRVFSDSPELLGPQLYRLDEPYTIVSASDIKSGVSTIRAMSMGSAIITSNSSFSWWGAWLGQHNKSGALDVVAPRPWNENGDSRADMLPKKWLTLDARD